MLYCLCFYINKKGVYYCLHHQIKQNILEMNLIPFNEIDTRYSKKKDNYVLKSKIETLISKKFGIDRVDIDSLINKEDNVWNLRYQAFTRKLNKEESVKVLYHMMNHRGIECTDYRCELDQKYLFLSEYIVKNKLESKGKQYNRCDVIDEVNLLLNKQIDFSNEFIDEKFINYVIKIINTDNSNHLIKEKQMDEKSSMQVQVVNIVNDVISAIKSKITRYLNIYVFIDSIVEDELEDSYNSIIDIKKNINLIKGEAANNEDILKYKLFMEQDRMCLYSQTELNIEKIFEKDYCEIDHIIPKSISDDDSISNKTLVLYQENRNKKSLTPWQYMKDDINKWNRYRDLVMNLGLCDNKKKRLLISDNDLQRYIKKIGVNKSSFLATITKKFCRELKKNYKELIYDYKVLKDTSLLDYILEYLMINSSDYTDIEYLYILLGSMLNIELINLYEKNTKINNDYGYFNKELDCIINRENLLLVANSQLL